MQPAEPFVVRPVLAFRVGVTGTLAVTAGAIAPLRRQVCAVLTHVKNQVEKLGNDPRAAGLYAAVPAKLRLLSPLAEGADRLVAEEALALGYELEVPMPFAQAEYEKDFPDSVAAFRALLGQAGGKELELDGARGDKETRERSYEAVGRLVARNCDLLIAIWDGGKGNGRGGTAEIVHYAAHHEQPVWWLHSDGSGDPHWIENLQHMRRPDDSLSGEAARVRLEAYLAEAILPAPDIQGTRRSVIEATLGGFLTETPRRDRAIWTIHRRFMRWAAGKQEKMSPIADAAPLAGEVWPYWQRFYTPVDRLAMDYGNRYRSSYVLVFALGAFVLNCAALELCIHSGAWFVMIPELVCLGVIFMIVDLNQSRRWHERLIAYRLLAELFRKQQALALVGWSLPVAAVVNISDGTADRAAPRPRDAMVGWYFNAAQRAAPLARGQLAGPNLSEVRRNITASLIAGQIDYHAYRWQDAKKAADCLGKLGTGLFACTIVIVFVKFLVSVAQYFWPRLDNVLYHGAIVAGFVAVLLPALSAGFVGIRSYAELELLADQSAQMQRLLTRTERQLRGLVLDAPLASQDLGAEIWRLAEGMLLDIKGWAQLFRVKPIEPV